MIRARKLLAQKDEARRKRLQVRGKMKNFIANMMREKLDTPEEDPMLNMTSQHESYDGTTDLTGAEAEKRNAEIFRNLTFD